MFRFLFRLILLAIFLVFLAFIFAPDLISTKWGKETFFKAYKSLTGNTLSADTFDISWWKGQKFQNLTVIYPKDKITFASPKVTTDATLWQIVFYKNLGNMELTSPQFVINTDLPLPVKKKPSTTASQAGFLPEITLSSIPMKSMPPYLGHIIVKDGTVKFLSHGFDPIDLQNVNLDASLFKTQIKLKGSGQTSQGTVKGNFDLALSYQPSQMDLSSNLNNFPVRSIDEIVSIYEPRMKGALLGSIGEAINVHLKLKNLPQTLELFCDASSPSFSAHIETAMQDGKATLAKPALIQFQIPPSFIHHFASLPLRNPLKGQIKIDKLSLPLNDRENCSFQATLKGEALQFPFGTVQPFTLFLSTESFKTRQFILKIDSPEVQLNSNIYLPQEWAQMNWNGEGLFPHNTQVKFSAQTLSAVTATVQGDQWKGSFSGGFDPKQNVVFLNKPAEIDYQLTQLPSPLPPILDKPTKLHVQVQPLRVSLGDISGLVSLKIHVDPTVVKGLTFGQTQISATGDLKSKKGTFELSSAVDQGSVNATGSLGWPQDISAKVTLVQFPSSFIDLFLGTDQIAPIVGAFLNGTVDISQLDQKKQLAFDVKSSALSATASLEQTGTAFNLTKPAKASLILSPEGYAALDHWLNKTPTPFKLNQPAFIAASINSLTIPQGKVAFSDLLCQADLSIDTLNFSAKNSEKSTQLNQIQLKIDCPKESPIAFALIAKGAPSGSLLVKGKLDPTTGSMDLNGRLDQFPSAALDILSLGKTSLATVLGSQVNLTATSTLSHWNGPVKLEINSSNVRASLDSVITNGILHLNDVFQMQITLTPDLSQALLNTVNPLSLSAITAHAPMTLEIPAQGFSYPLFPSNDTQINIPSGRLDLGKLSCRNEGNLNITLGLLKQSQFSKNQDLELWFAPLDFHIVNGEMECERTEILIANTYQVCVWGGLDFPAKKVDMVLGLTASCLKTAFGIKDLPNDYILQIPMKGSMNNVKINTGKATAKIAALLLWQQKDLSGAFGKSSGGKALGQFMNKVGPLPDLGSKAPPAKRPFPWESGYQNPPPKKKKKTSKAQTPKDILPDGESLKQVLKMLH